MCDTILVSGALMRLKPPQLLPLLLSSPYPMPPLSSSFNPMMATTICPSSASCHCCQLLCKKNGQAILSRGGKRGWQEVCQEAKRCKKARWSLAPITHSCRQSRIRPRWSIHRRQSSNLSMLLAMHWLVGWLPNSQPSEVGGLQTFNASDNASAEKMIFWTCVSRFIHTSLVKLNSLLKVSNDLS